MTRRALAGRWGAAPPLVGLLGLMGLTSCGSYAQDDLGEACLALEDGTLTATVVVSGGENGPDGAACRMEAEADDVRLRTTSTWRRDRTPFTSTAIARMAQATCTMAWAGPSARVWLRDTAVSLDDGDAACTGGATWMLLGQDTGR